MRRGGRYSILSLLTSGRGGGGGGGEKVPTGEALSISPFQGGSPVGGGKVLRERVII